MMRTSYTFLAACGSLVVPATVLGQDGECLKEFVPAYPDAPQVNDQFGVNTAFAGDRLVGSAFFAGPGDTGVVYVFSRGVSGWTQEGALIGSSVDAIVGFGLWMDASDNTILVGNPFIDKISHGEGAAYFFESVDGAWTEVARVAPSDQQNPLTFGVGVAVEGDIAFIADWDPGDGVYVFERVDGIWTETGNIQPVTPDAFIFGADLMYVNGDLIASEGALDDQGFFTKNQIRVFRRGDKAWEHVQTLTEPIADADWGERFWEAGGQLIISAGEDDTGAEDSGAVYCYAQMQGQWELAQVIVNPNPEESSSFGSVGAGDDDRFVTGGSDTLYLYARTDGQWTLTDQIDVARIGSLAMSREWIADGNAGDDTNGTNAGAVYTYEDTCFCPADCNADGRINIFDFLCFQGLVTNGDDGADCNDDARINIFDVLCFQGLVTQGCE